MAELDLRLLGGFEVMNASGARLTFATSKARALLAVLGRHPGKRHGREALAGLLWPESADAQARASLRQTLKHARRALGDLRDQAVVDEADTLGLNPEVVEVDADGFGRLHAQGTPEALEAAAQLYRGEFLEGFSLRAAPFADWVALERVQLGERALDVLARLAAHFADAGETERAITQALRLLALDPLQEETHRLLMRLYDAQGRRGAAIEQYRRCREILRRELSARPEPETERLYHGVRATRPRVEAARFAFEPGAGDGAEPAQAVVADPLLQRPAVVVLPFRNLCGDPGQSYFAEGLSEDLITALAGWRCFPLIASTSAFTCDRRAQPHRIADDLGARYVVDGSARRSGPRLRISARLVEAETAYTLWTERFDFHLDDILVVQEEAAQKIAAMLEPELERAELRRIITKRTEDLIAWDLRLQGTSFLNRRTPESNAHARSRFEQAVRLDPGYGDAFTGLAYGYLWDIWETAPDARGPLIENAREAARRAIALDRDSSMAHLAFATAHVWAERFDVALPETELAVELNPSNARARGGLGNRLDLIGRTDEGIAHLEAGLRLDPRSPDTWSFVGFLSRAYLSAERYEDALGAAQKAVGLRPDQPVAHYRLAVCLAHLDRADEARAALGQCKHLRPGFLETRRGWRPYPDPARNEHFFAGLRRHGLVG